MKPLYIAKTKSGHIMLFSYVAHYDPTTDLWLDPGDMGHSAIFIGEGNDCPKLTFENSPQPVKLRFSNAFDLGKPTDVDWNPEFCPLPICENCNYKGMCYANQNKI